MIIRKVHVIALLCAIVLFSSYRWTNRGFEITVRIQKVTSLSSSSPFTTRPLLPGMGDDDPPEPPEEFFQRRDRYGLTCLDHMTCARNPPRFPDAFRAIDKMCPSNYSGPTTNTFDAAAVVKAGPPFESPFFEPLNETALRDHVLCYGAPLKPVRKSSSPCPFALWLPLRMSAHLIEQWVLWYTSMGVCRFYIYDNDPGGGPYGHMFRCNPNVHVIPWPTRANRTTQYSANKHFLQNFKRLHVYGAQLDGDEFMTMRHNRTIVEFVEHHLGLHKNAGSIDIQWRTSASTSTDCWAEDVPAAVRFRNGEFRYNRHTKPLLLLSQVISISNPHIGNLRRNGVAIRSNGLLHSANSRSFPEHTGEELYVAEIHHIMQTVEERTIRRIFAPNRGRPTFAPKKQDFASEVPFVANISAGIKVIREMPHVGSLFKMVSSSKKIPVLGFYYRWAMMHQIYADLREYRPQSPFYFESFSRNPILRSFRDSD